MTSWIVLIFGALTAAGGAMGYVKAQSVPSLIAGGASGLILIGSAIAMMRGAYQPGWWISVIVTLVLLARFSMAATKGFKMMPGGMMIIMSLIALAVLITHRSAE